MRPSFPCGPRSTTISVMEEDEYPEFMVAMESDIDADTAAVIQMAALMLNQDGPGAYMRALEIPLAAVGSTLTMAASMIATLVENVAEHEECSAEQVLLELRNWMEDPGERDE